MSDGCYMSEDDILIIYDILNVIPDMQVIEDVTIQKNEFPLVGIHSTGLYVFLGEGLVSDYIKEIEDKVYPLQQVLGLSRGKMHVYSTDGEKWSYLNPYTNEGENVDDIEHHIQDIVTSGIYLIDEGHTGYYYDKLTLSNGERGDIRVMSDGESYVMRNGRWFPASTEDTDEVFKKACLFGFLGWYQFHRKKKFSGVLYFLTCGLFGVGWVFDAISFLVGGARDSEGKYYTPLSDKRKGWLMILGVCGVAVVFVYVWAILFNLINGGISTFLAKILEKQNLDAVEQSLEQSLSSKP